MPRLHPEEPIPGLPGLTVGDFWSWAYSDILSNRNRGIFAEFLVGAALGVIDGSRIEWDAYDLNYEGRRIEVKSAAFVQSWNQKRPSTITFSIGRSLAWDAETGSSAPEAVRTADCYVFCLFKEMDKLRANVTDITQWEFYVVATRRIDDLCGGQKSLGLATLRARLAQPVAFAGLKAAVDHILGEARANAP